MLTFAVRARINARLFVQWSADDSRGTGVHTGAKILGFGGMSGEVDENTSIKVLYV